MKKLPKFKYVPKAHDYLFDRSNGEAGPLDVHELFSSIGSDGKVEYQGALQRVLAFVERHDPLHLLATLVTFGLANSLKDDGMFEMQDHQFPIYQSDIELLQAIALRLPPQQRDPVGLETLPEFFRDTQALGQAFGLKEWGNIRGHESEADQARFMLQLAVREHSQRIRQWGYSHHVADTLVKLFTPLDEQLVKNCGMNSRNVLDIFDALIKNLTEGMNEFRDGAHAETRGKTKRAVVERYLNAFDIPEPLRTFFTGFIKRKDLTVSKVRYALFHHTLLYLPAFFIFDAKTISEATAIPEAVVSSFLDRCSIERGNLSDISIDSLFLENPVWNKPCIRLDAGIYFCVTPHTFLAFAFPILESMLITDSESKSAYHDRRADFLEDEIKKLFEEAFPTAKVIRDFKWKEKGIQYDNDVLVYVDTHLIVIEAKSGGLSKKALYEQDLEWLRVHIERLIVHPEKQSRRLADKIQRAQAEPSQHEGFLRIFPFPIEKIRHVVRISITLEDFANIQNNLELLRLAGLVPDDFNPIPTMYLTDLRSVFEILDTSLEKIHYLTRRDESNTTHIYQGDEMDLLCAYLDNCFNRFEKSDGKLTIMLHQASYPVDNYFAAQSMGIRTPKPRTRLSGWWRDIIQRVETKRMDRWTELAYLLLGTPHELQIEVEKDRDKTARALRAGKKVMDCLSYKIHAKVPYNIFMAFVRESQVVDRLALLEDAAIRIFADPTINTCLGIAVNIDKKFYPYSLLGVFYRDEITRGDNLGAS